MIWTQFNLLDSLSRETRKKDTLHCFGKMMVRSRAVKELELFHVANAFTIPPSWVV